MDPLLKQLTQLQKQLQKLPKQVLYGGIAVASLVVLGVVLLPALTGDGHYQYVFTNLTAEDSTEAAEHLKGAGIPFKVEAGGGAISVPESKVYDARLLLASVGLPRGGGVGFELFDHGDLGVSEFTQRVNLRRALEGELARTIGHLSEVRSARVHLTFEEKTLFRDDERKAAAAVVVNLQPGRTLDERAITGIRHLVASSVPGLSPEGVTIVDGSGRALSTDGADADAQNAEDLERALEKRLVTLLETVTGPGAVVARVNASLDDAEVTTNSEVFDPDSAALRSEHKSSQNQNQQSGAPAGLAGAAANQPPVQNAAQPQTAQNQSTGNSQSEDQLRNYELSKTVTRTVKRTPRLARLSAAVLIDGVNGKPRSPEEIARFGELAKRAIGFDVARGDVLEISSEVFAKSGEEAASVAEAAAQASKLEKYKWLGAGIGALLLLAGLAAFFLLRRGRQRTQTGLVLQPGQRVSELEDQLARPALVEPLPVAPQQLIDPAVALRNKALELVQKNPSRAAHLLRAWIAADAEGAVGNG